MSDLRRRIEALEASTPVAITLTLKDGSTFHHPGPSMKFYEEGFEQIRNGKGPLLKALRTTVEGTGCGLLWELLVALSVGPLPVGGRPSAPLTAPPV